MKCQHGGVPNSQCIACVNCASAWTGKYCETWENAVHFSEASEDLVLLIQGAQAEQTQQKRSDPKLPTALGQGTDISSGDIKFPVLSLQYSSPSFQCGSRSWSMAVDTSASIIDKRSETSSKVFAGLSSYLASIYSYDLSGQVSPTLLSKGKEIGDIVQEYFQSTFIIVSQEKTPLFVANLTKSIIPGSYNFDKRFLRAIQSLPPTYDTPSNKALYRLFIDNWGTHGIQSSVNGGMLEQLSITQNSVLGAGFTPEQLAQIANSEFLASVINGGDVSIPDSYRNSRSLSVLACAGGNAAELCSRDLLSNWKTQIDALPYPISYTVFDYTALLEEPLRSNVRLAIQSYVGEVRNTQASVCRYGEYDVSSNQCICRNEKISGKRCELCIRGWRGVNCALPLCAPRCRYCKKPYECMDAGCSSWNERDLNSNRREIEKPLPDFPWTNKEMSYVCPHSGWF